MSTTNDTIKFEVGKTYSTRSACNHEMVYSWTVVRRTEKCVWLRERDGDKDVRRSVKVYEDGIETIYPDGRYSMCPVLSADRPDLADEIDTMGSSRLQVSDDRTPVKFCSFAEYADYHVVGRDTCLSGWGLAEGGRSFAVWACTSAQVERVEAWVANRGDMVDVRIVKGTLTTKPDDHVSVYFVDDQHPALRDLK